MASAPVWLLWGGARFYLAAALKAARSFRLNLAAATRKLEVLRKRAEFLAVAENGKRWVAPGFILQIGADKEPSDKIRYGLTASRKVGNAVVRNKCRRRLRALAAELLPNASSSHDYVLIARATTATCEFSELRRDMLKGMKRMKIAAETTT